VQCHQSTNFSNGSRILEEIQVDLFENKLTQYKQKWSYHVSRIGDVRYPKQLIDRRHIGRRRPGRPLKGLLGGYNREIETGYLVE